MNTIALHSKTTETSRETLWNQLLAWFYRACLEDSRGNTEKAVALLEWEVAPLLEKYATHGDRSPEELKARLMELFSRFESNHPARQTSIKSEITEKTSIPSRPRNIPFDDVSAMIDSVQLYQINA